MSEKIKVLVVDDSALMRNLISRMVEETEGLEVVGKAMNGLFALKKLSTLNPDAIVLDLEMPEMNGIEFLEKRKELKLEVPVIILSSLASKGAKITMEALALGASDFVQKPSGSVSDDIHKVKEILGGMLLAYGSQYQKEKPASSPVNMSTPALRPSLPVADHSMEGIKEAPSRQHGEKEILAIGISTGGPNALRQILPLLSKNLPWPVLVVQHMPEGFTREFANSLNKICSLEVKEGEKGDLIKRGRILIAPGNQQMGVERRSLGAVLALAPEAPPKNGHKPSVGYLFDTLVEVYGSKVIALIMTGMGKDGSEEIGKIYKAGGLTLAQDGPSSVVYGMPKVAAQMGHVEKILSLEEIAPFLNQLAHSSRE